MIHHRSPHSPNAPALRRTWICLASIVVATACDAAPPAYPPPPETVQSLVTDTIHGFVLTDPYRWLEDQESPETRAWIAAQNAYAEQIVGDTSLRAALERRMAELTDHPGAVYPRRSGSYEYFSLRRPGDEVSRIYRRPAPAERYGDPLDLTEDFEIVIDPLSLNPDGTTSVSILDLSADGRLMLYGVRDGGQDERTIHIRNLSTGRDLPDSLPNALYSSVSFTPNGSAFYYSRRSRIDGARIYRHILGTDVSDDEVLFGEGQGPERFVNVMQAEDGRYLIYTVQHGWIKTEVYLQDLSSGEPPVPVVTDETARFSPRFVNGELFLLTNFRAPRNRLMAVDPSNPGDKNNWREVISEGAELLTNYHVIGDKIYATTLDDVNSRIFVHGLDGSYVDELPVPPHQVASLRPWGEETALLTLSSLTMPTRVVKIDLETMETELWLASTVPFKRSDYEIKKVRYSSLGATPPIYLAHRAGLKLTGDTPTLLYGYGGFNVNVLPRFDARAAAWIENGGVYAIATLRGGGEFGENWHRDGMLGNKKNVFADFISAAEWLIDNDYTNPDRLAIRGVSNGGLLMGAVLTQRPDLFRAVFAGFPDLDMARFYQFTETNNAPALLEYGNGGLAAEFGPLLDFSPYQNVQERVKYPAVMLTQGDLDTRVPPLQARKMAARLQAASTSGLPVILDYDPRAGHAGGRTFSRNVRNTAMELAFLMQMVGMKGPLSAPPSGIP